MAQSTNPTKEQILEAAATSPEAKKALSTLFPQYFAPELLKFPIVGRSIVSFPECIEGFRKDTDINIRVALGMARKLEHQDRLIVFDTDNRKSKFNLVMFDNSGERVASIPFSRDTYAFIGIETIK